MIMILYILIFSIKIENIKFNIKMLNKIKYDIRQDTHTYFKVALCLLIPPKKC